MNRGDKKKYKLFITVKPKARKPTDGAYKIATPCNDRYKHLLSLQDYNEEGESSEAKNAPTYNDILELKKSLLTRWKDSDKKNEN